MWIKVYFNIQNIVTETAKAYLIALPHKSDYDGFTFWVSKKLVRSGTHSYERALTINTDMTFNIKRISERTYKVLDERTISAEELQEAFECRS